MFDDLNVNLVVSSDQIQEGELIDKSNADVLKGWYYPEVSPLPVLHFDDYVTSCLTNQRENSTLKIAKRWPSRKSKKSSSSLRKRAATSGITT